MAVTINATPADPTANSYLTEAEAAAYFATRLPLPIPWDDAEDKTALLAMATRTMDVMMRGQRTLLIAARGSSGGSRGSGGGRNASGDRYIIRRLWTGVPATTTQRLAWPRLGMYDANNVPIPPNVIPQDLKFATAELAGQLLQEDRTLDNDVEVRGISSVSAGSVRVSFGGSSVAVPQVLPDATINLLVPSWYTEERVISTLINVDIEVI